MNTYTLIQTEESFEQFHGCGIQDAVKVCLGDAEVSKFVFEVIHKRLVETYERDFHLGELVELGIPKEMLDAFHKMEFAKRKRSPKGEKVSEMSPEYPSLVTDFEIAEKAGWMNISIQDLLLFLNEDVDEPITWHIIQGAPIVGKAKPGPKDMMLSKGDEPLPCHECGELVTYDGPPCKCERDAEDDVDEQKWCPDCGDEIESECFACCMTNVRTGETKVVCDGCVEELDKDLWIEG